MITEREAETITNILLKAHDGCVLCSRELCQEFIEQFPAYRTVVTVAWKMSHPDTPLYPQPVRLYMGGVPL